MNIKNKNLQDGLFFFFLGILLLGYSFYFYINSFDHLLAQSPYLFPGIISIFFIALSGSLIYQGMKQPISSDAKGNPTNLKGVFMVLLMTALYYVFLMAAPLPYITFGFPFISITITNFEIATVIYLFALMFYLGVRKLSVLILAPIITSLFLSVAFRSLLRVLLP